MPTSPVLSFLNQALHQLGTRFTPPVWLVDELQARIVLLLNHIIAQEPQAVARLLRQKGRIVRFHWNGFEMNLVATAAGLLDRVGPQALPDLTLQVTESSAAEVLQTLARGATPPVKIEGDVQLAAEINWLADHVRWDAEEDLARIVGDVPAHMLGNAVRQALAMLKPFANTNQQAPAARADA